MSKRGRKPLPPAPEQTQGDAALIASDLKAADAMHQQLAVIDEQYGGGALYARDRVIAEVKFFMKTTSEAAIEVGRRLILLKEHEGHGKFLPALQELGINVRTAQRMMLIAVKFGKYDSLSHLEPSKLVELSYLDDADLKELEKGGTVAGIEFDDLDRLSVRELKQKLRDVQADHEATQKVLDDKNKKIDKLTRDIKKLPEVREWPEECAGLVEAIQATTNEVLKPLHTLSQQVEALHMLMMEEEPDAEPARLTAIQVTNDLHTLVNALAQIQQFTYEAFAAQLGSTYTSLLQQNQ